jgi:hypothetical protein
MNLKDLLLKSYKKCISFQEVLFAFSKASKAESLMIWQKSGDDRNIFWIRNWEIEHASERVVILNDSGRPIKINPANPVYIKLPFREAILKTKVEFVSDVGISLKIPEELFWREFRGSPRINFNSGEKTAEVRPNISNVQTKNLSTYKVNLKDISKHGMGIIVSDVNHHFFRPGLLIEILSVDDGFMLTPKIGHIVYCVKEERGEDKKSGGYRVGIKMLKPFADDFLDKLTKKPDSHFNVLSSDILSDEFKKMVDEEIDSTFQKIKKNPSLSKYLTQLEISRSEDNYLEEHIKVLCVICTYIARSLHWVSDASAQKLIYVAYLHDAPLFANPKLAKILNIREFAHVKNKLTEDEQKLYLSAPEKAYNIAMSDPTAPPDAAQMLYMQKELPSGDGFPRRLNSTKITPMASLFIVAHDLTNELIKSEDWSIEAWLLRAKGTYRGGPFGKIIDVIEQHKFAFKKQR